MTTFFSTNKQSMIDMCLQSYGTLDLLVKFCNDNSIDSVNYIPPKPQAFVFDERLITDQKTLNYKYATGVAVADPPEVFLTTDDDIPIYTDDDHLVLID